MGVAAEIILLDWMRESLIGKKLSEKRRKYGKSNKFDGKVINCNTQIA
jgi:hypothetical protein